MYKNIYQNNQNDIMVSSKKTKLLKKNEIIYNEKEEISNIFFILDGVVESTNSKNLKAPLKLEKGSSLGLIDTILDRPFSRNMKAKSTVSLAVIEKGMIKNILASNTFSGALIKSLVIDIDNKHPNTWS